MRLARDAASCRNPPAPYASIPNSFAAVRPRMSALSSSLSEVAGKDVVDRRELPGERIVAAEHDLPGAHLRREMTDRLRREHQRIEIDLLEVFGRLLRKLDVGIAAAGIDQAGMVGTVGIGRQEAAAMGGDHLQLGEAIEGALEDQVRQRDRRLRGIGDGVGEPAIAGHQLVEFGHALRMDEQGHAEFFRLGPDRMEFRIGKRHAVDIAADRRALQPLPLHRGLQLLHREIRRLQGQRGKAGKPVRLRGAEGGEFFVLDLDDLRRPVRGRPCTSSD